MPAATASSTAYWMSGLSTIGSISLGDALVAGRKRVPRPATGKTALVTFCIFYAPSSLRNCSSSSTATPSSRARSSFEPASSPATT